MSGIFTYNNFTFQNIFAKNSNSESDTVVIVRYNNMYDQILDTYTGIKFKTTGAARIWINGKSNDTTESREIQIIDADVARVLTTMSFTQKSRLYYDDDGGLSGTGRNFFIDSAGGSVQIFSIYVE